MVETQTNIYIYIYVCHGISLHFGMLIFVYIYIPIQFGGFNPSDKHEFVSWDDEIPNGKIKARFQTTNQ